MRPTVVHRFDLDEVKESETLAEAAQPVERKRAPNGSQGAVIAAGRASAGEGFAQRVFSAERRHGFPLSTMTKSNAITTHPATAAMTAPDVTKANGFNMHDTYPDAFAR